LVDFSFQLSLCTAATLMAALCFWAHWLDGLPVQGQVLRLPRDIG